MSRDCLLAPCQPPELRNLRKKIPLFPSNLRHCQPGTCATCCPPKSPSDRMVTCRWKPVYGEIEFECGHWAVFENAIDMAHIHYLHSDSFGNKVRVRCFGVQVQLSEFVDADGSKLASPASCVCSAEQVGIWLFADVSMCFILQEKPSIREMEAKNDAYSVSATFSLTNKPVNALWEWSKVRCTAARLCELSVACIVERSAASCADVAAAACCLNRAMPRCPQVKEVKVTAKAMLPSTSVITFTLGEHCICLCSIGSRLFELLLARWLRCSCGGLQLLCSLTHKNLAGCCLKANAAFAGMGLSFSTVVNTVPINEGRTINRFALIRNLETPIAPGAANAIFNMNAWDKFARDAMIKCVL